MTKQAPSDYRICAVCGASKPMRAFLQMNEDETRYGVVCSQCRSEGKDIEQESGETVRTDSGKRIDSKSKTAEETEHRLTLRRVLHADMDEHQRQEDEETEVRIKQEEVKKKEFKHRISFLTGNSQAKKITPVIQTEAERRQFAQQQVVKEQNKQNYNQEAERKKTGLDFSTSFLNPQYENEERFKSADYIKYRSWLGGAAPIAQKEAQRMVQEKQQNETVKKDVERITKFIDDEFTKPRRRR